MLLIKKLARKPTGFSYPLGLHSGMLASPNLEYPKLSTFILARTGSLHPS